MAVREWGKDPWSDQTQPVSCMIIIVLELNDYS